MNKKNKFILKMLGLVKKYNLITNKSTIPKTPKENYILNVYKLFHIVDDSINKLDLFEHYLTIDPFPNHYLENNINESDYYKFQLENFYIRCSSIFDFKMHLINKTLNLGFKKCSYDLIKDNSNIKDTILKTKIINLNSYLQKVIEKRNKIIHHGHFDSELLDGITAFLSIPNLPEELYDEEYEIYSKTEKDKNIKEAIKELNLIIKKLKFYFEEILEELIPIIEQQIIIFELKEKS